jgi:integrase
MVADQRGGAKHPRRIKRLEKAWGIACKAAGYPGTIPHDMRRSAIRNMTRAGISERVAMRLSGHRTRSTFDRYNIVADADLDIAAERLSAMEKSPTVSASSD